MGPLNNQPSAVPVFEVAWHFWILGKLTLKNMVHIFITIYDMPLCKVLWKILCVNQKQGVIFSKLG